MRPYTFNVAVQWFVLGLTAGVIFTAAVACEPTPNCSDYYPSGP